MGNFIPVEPEKWAEMVKAAASSDYWRIEAETDHARWLRTLEENEKLRAEVERFKFTLEEERQITRQDWAGLRCEHDRVKRALEQAEAENERLRKAGDMMYHWLGVCGRRNNSFGDDWLRAKKGAMLQAEQFDLDMKKKGWTGWNAAKEGKDR